MGSKLDGMVQALPRLLLVFAMGAAAVPAAVLATYSWRGSIEHFTWIFLPAVLVGPLLAVAALGLGLFAVRNGVEPTKSRLEWAAAALLRLFAIAFVLAPSYPAGRLLNYRDVRAARSYCMMLVPRIEAASRQ